MIFRATLFFIHFLVCQSELVIASPHPSFLKEEFEIGLKKYFKTRLGIDIKVIWFELGGAIDILRYILQFREQSGIDIVFGGGTDPFEELKRENLLDKIELPGEIDNQIPKTLGDLYLKDPDLTWISVSLSCFGLAFHKTLVTNLIQKKDLFWTDLTHPSFFKKIAISDPRKSGSARFIYEIILQNFGWNEGWRIFYHLARNANSFAFHSSELIKKLSLGEVVLAPMIESHGERAKRITKNLDFKIPSDVAVYFGDAIGILKHGKNKKYAKIAVEFALTEFQKTLTYRLATPGGPLKYQISRMAANPVVYESPHVAEEIHNPFKSHTVLKSSFDTKLSVSRWYELSTLFGGIIVDFGYKFKKINPARIDLLPPPIPEDEFSKIVDTKKWRKASQKDIDLARIRVQLSSYF
ncbi:MAG: ABC transporter substrate-binding protein [Deltaproteobacteria bacterium]|nr:ABC transporter substrate-binding protein [Deltaproteobacteria bacterium]